MVKFTFNNFMNKIMFRRILNLLNTNVKLLNFQIRIFSPKTLYRSIINKSINQLQYTIFLLNAKLSDLKIRIF